MDWIRRVDHVVQRYVTTEWPYVTHTGVVRVPHGRLGARRTPGPAREPVEAPAGTAAQMAAATRTPTRVRVATSRPSCG